MNGIDKILDNIREQTKIDCEAIIKEAKEKSSKQLSSELEKAEKKATAELESAKKEAISLVEGAKSTAALERKKMLLSAKRQMVDEVLDRSAIAFAQLDKESYVKFLASLAKSFKKGTLFFSVKDKALGKDVLALLGSDSFSLSEETSELESGFLIKDGSTEAEGSVEALIGEMRRELEPETSKLLF